MNRNTFKPISNCISIIVIIGILDNQGLDLNENDFNYDMNRNPTGTMYGDFRTTFYDGER